MRKTLLTMVAMMATSSAMMAQNGITEIPDPEGVQLMGTTLSPNGKFFGGVGYGVNEAWIYNMESKKFVAFPAADTEADVQIKSMADNGVAVGWSGPAATFDFATEQCTQFGEDGQYTFMGISPDGKLIVGARYDTEDGEGIPCIFNEGTPVDLPQPSNKFLGANSAGASALSVSNDSIISGYWVDDMATRPALLWAPNRDGKTFMPYPFSRPYFAATTESTLPFTIFSCDQTVMSANGKYLVINYEQYTGEWEAIQSVARYNTENDSLELFTPNAEDEMFVDPGSQVFGCAVSDEGTIVGFYGGLYGPRLGFIWKKGDESIKALASEFPKATLLADYDNGAFNVPSAISADGRYIAGFAYKEGETSDELGGGYVSWVLDTQYDDTDAVESAPSADGAANKVVARFTADGKQVQKDAKVRGFNMMLMRNGKAIKSFNR